LSIIEISQLNSIKTPKIIQIGAIIVLIFKDETTNDQFCCQKYFNLSIRQYGSEISCKGRKDIDKIAKNPSLIAVRFLVASLLGMTKYTLRNQRAARQSGTLQFASTFCAAPLFIPMRSYVILSAATDLSANSIQDDNLL
jgi:hypothetical protein